MEQLWIYGTGALAEKIYYYNERDKKYCLMGFIDDNDNRPKEYKGLPVLSYPEFKKLYQPGSCKLFVAIGYVKCNYFREIVFKKVQNDGYELINYISPNSICFNGNFLGSNILICDNVFVGHGSIIEDGVILSVGCTLSHENTIERFSFISSCVVFGGHSKVKNNCFVGIHSTVRDGITIAEYNIVGAGTNLLKTTEPYTLTTGNPGRSQKRDTLQLSI